MSDEQKKYDRLTHDHEGTPRVFDKEIKEFDREKFGEDIQKILSKFQFQGETRRQIFLELMAIADWAPGLNVEQQAGNPQKGSQNDQS